MQAKAMRNYHFRHPFDNSPAALPWPTDSPETVRKLADLTRSHAKATMQTLAEPPLRDPGQQAPTGHSPLHMRLTIPNLPPSPPLKRYPEPMAHGPVACEPLHPLWPMARRPVSCHTRAEAYPCLLTREVWNPISKH